MSVVTTGRPPGSTLRDPDPPAPADAERGSTPGRGTNPFGAAPGADAAVLPTPASALWSQRHTLKALKPRLERLMATVDHRQDLVPYQWGQLFAFATEFRPDLILELGRGRGNSTCVFTEAARRSPGCRVVSVCNSSDWRVRTRRDVAREVEPDWFDPLEILEADLREVDYAPVVGDAKRVFVFWDAHGFDVAECILGEIFPRIAGGDTLIAMHDISDVASRDRFDRSYRDQPLWRGNSWDGPRLMLGNLIGSVEQLVAIADFASRNGLRLRGAEESLEREIGNDPERMSELETLLGEPWFSTRLLAHWIWFSLSEMERPLQTPAFTVPSAAPEETASSLQRREIAARLCDDLARDMGVDGRPSWTTRARIVAKLLLRRYEQRPRRTSSS